MEANQQNALQYLQDIGKPKSEGYVSFFNGQPEGWSADPDVTTYQPGVVVVNIQTGERRVAKGGNEYNGAQRWEPLP